MQAFNYPIDNDGRPEPVSDRLIEWIELLSLLGAKKIFFYNLTPVLHPNIRKVSSSKKLVTVVGQFTGGSNFWL